MFGDAAPIDVSNSIESPEIQANKHDLENPRTGWMALAFADRLRRSVHRPGWLALRRQRLSWIMQIFRR